MINDYYKKIVDKSLHKEDEDDAANSLDLLVGDAEGIVSQWAANLKLDQKGRGQEQMRAVC